MELINLTTIAVLCGAVTIMLQIFPSTKFLVTAVKCTGVLETVRCSVLHASTGIGVLGAMDATIGVILALIFATCVVCFDLGYLVWIGYQHLPQFVL